jgi:hypothetical protein
MSQRMSELVSVTGNSWPQLGTLTILRLAESSGLMHFKMTPPHGVERALSKPPFSDPRSDECARQNTFVGRLYPLPQ